MPVEFADRKSTRLNSSHTEIYTLSLHDALPIWISCRRQFSTWGNIVPALAEKGLSVLTCSTNAGRVCRSEEHTSELQSHRDLHSFPTRRSSDLDLLQTAVLNVGQHSTRFGGERPERADLLH